MKHVTSRHPICDVTTVVIYPICDATTVILNHICDATTIVVKPICDVTTVVVNPICDVTTVIVNPICVVTPATANSRYLNNKTYELWSISRFTVDYYIAVFQYRSGKLFSLFSLTFVHTQAQQLTLNHYRCPVTLAN